MDIESSFDRTQQPMRFTLFAKITSIMLVMVACSSPRPNPVGTSTAEQISSPDSRAGSFFAINEVGLGSNGYVTLTNFTDQPASLGGLFLCQGAECFSLPRVDVAPGTAVRIAVGNGDGLDGVVANGATIGELKPSDGEVALFASDRFNDPKALLAYLQWGSTPHALTDLAVDAGLWIKSGYAPTTENATRLYRVVESGLWLFEEAKP